MIDLKLVALSSSNLKEFRSLLGGPEFGGCFCAVWRSFDDTWSARCADQTQPNFAITRAHVQAGQHVGYLVYEGDALVAWTGAGPKCELPMLATKLASRLSPSDASTWSIGCLAVRASERGRNLPERILQAVCETARAAGARCIEAYPVRPFHEPRRFRGTEGLYLRNAFREVGSERDGEHEVLLMKLNLEKSS